jgi:hypothetical protein
MASGKGASDRMARAIDVLDAIAILVLTIIGIALTLKGY